MIYVYLDRVSKWLGGGGLRHEAVASGEPDLLPAMEPVPHREAAE